MGLKVERERFDPVDYRRFEARLEQSLEALRRLLGRPGFGEAPRTLGAELELFLIDAHGRPLPISERVLEETSDPRLTVELDRFNLECNLRPTPLAGRPFTALAGEFRGAVEEVRRAAGLHGGRVAMIGILPTLVETDLQSHAMTDAPRYRALSAALRQLRRGPFRLVIDGEEPLDIACDDVTFEGANTSLQLHLRVDPADFARVFNAVQLATAPAVAVAGNSPTFLGRQLWDETRIAVFKQAVDDRGAGKVGESRVAFGPGWVAEGAAELFERAVVRHEPLLPVISDEDPLACLEAGGVPQLEELRLHQGTVWHWNRAVYDPAAGGHLRVEMRGLPAGPTVVDMVANTAFLVGLALGIARDAEAWTRELPFAVPEHSFYRAAQDGLDAQLLFPRGPGEAAEPVAASELVGRLLPLAHEGLVEAGVDAEESERCLAPIRRRLSEGRTGARWQRQALAAREPRIGRPRALAAMLEEYLENAGSERPVASWERAAMQEEPLTARLAPGPEAVPERVEDWLRELGGPSVLRLPGRDRSRTRAVTTLLHGNEPSGVRALHGLLREGFVPAVDALCFIGSVDAALAEPGFAWRHLEGALDLNRCFRSLEGREGALARALLAILREAEPEALVDLHNNTGRSIPYGVGPRAGMPELGLVACFADRYVHSDLQLGALVEMTAEEFPTVVIECGRAGAPAADAVAEAGLRRYLGAPRLGREAEAAGVEVVSEPVRVEVAPGTRLALGDGPHPDADLTLAAELDQHNFARLEAGHAIGWVREGAAWPLRAVNGAGRDVSEHLFEVAGHVLRCRDEIVPIMITNDPGIALDDCLFYVVRRTSPRS